MRFTEMISKSPEDVAAISDADILREAYPIDEYDYSLAQRDTIMALRARLAQLQAPAPKINFAGCPSVDTPDAYELGY